MSILDEQFELLKAQNGFSGAEIRKVGDGSAVIIVPNFPLPQGWSKDRVTVKFIAPVGYPHAKPDCFWVDQDLRLAGGGMPQAANISAIPGTGEMQVWFSWHTGQWYANRDTLLTYLNVIRGRFQQAR